MSCGSEMRRIGRAYAAGFAQGPALVLREPLSFWGGLAAQTGDIIDRSHPDLGRNVTGRVLVMPGGRGSSSSSSVLAEAIRLGTAPLAIVLARPDPIMVVGCLVPQLLYGLSLPVIVCSIEGIADGDPMRVVCAVGQEASIDWESLASGDRVTAG